MSRRPLAHPVERLAKAQSRMAPGGLLWSESPIPRRYSPRVRSAGDEPVVDPPVVDSFTLRPAILDDYYSMSGPEATALRDMSDSTYVRCRWISSPSSLSLVATFETASVPFTPVMSELHIRACSQNGPPGVIQWAIAGNIYPGAAYTPYWGDYDWNENHESFVPGTTYGDHVAEWWTDAPTAAEVAAGGIQIIVSASSMPATWDLLVSDIWLVLYPTWHPPMS